MTKRFEWNEGKNQKLKQERGISFEAIISYIESGDILAIAEGKGTYSHQKQFVVAINNYVYVVPFIEETEYIFLKTIIPSRKLTKQFLSETGGKSSEETSNG